MYAERGQNLDEAIQLIEKALEIEPENGYFIDSLGWAYYQQGRYPEALRELKRAVERAKDDPVIFEHLGDAYAKNGLQRGCPGRLGEVVPARSHRWPSRTRSRRRRPTSAG